MREGGSEPGASAQADGASTAGQRVPGWTGSRWPALAVLLLLAVPLASAAGAGSGLFHEERVAVAFSAAHDVGPPPGVSGGFGEPTCLNCHTGEPLNAYGGSVRVEGLPDAFEPGQSYPLAVVLSAEGTVLAGFQLTARYADGGRAGDPAGVLSPLDGRVTVTSGETGQPYLHQTQAGSIPESDTGTSWMLEWRAPDAGGPVVFNVAANSANGDQSPLLDLVYASEVRVEPAGGR